jgi:hypothetical protein
VSSAGLPWWLWFEDIFVRSKNQSIFYKVAFYFPPAAFPTANAASTFPPFPHRPSPVAGKSAHFALINRVTSRPRPRRASRSTHPSFAENVMKTSHAPSLRHIAACALLAAVAPAFAADIPSNLKNAAQSKYRDAALQIPNYDPNAQTFVHQPPKEGVENRAAVKVTLPPQAKPGEHPRLLLTKEEVAKMRESLTSTERGKQTYATLLKIADGALAGGGKPTFPDPKGTPSQHKDRNDPIMKQHDRLSHSASALGMAYLFSNNKKYADAAAAILKGYADLYPQYPEHKGVNRSETGKISAQRLSESMWLIPLIEAYDAIYDSGSLTDADKKNIEQNLLLEAVTFIRRKGTPAEEAAARTRLDPNWRTSTPPPTPANAASSH